MSRFLTLLTAVVVLAALKAAVTVLVIVLAGILLFYTVTRPRQTLMFLTNVVLLGLASTHPVAFIIGVGIVGAAVVLVAWRQKRQPSSGQRALDRPQLLETSDREPLG